MAHTFTTLNNFRDLGYLKTTDGHRLQNRRLLRCGVPSGLCEADKRALREVYNLSLFIDLRAPSEISRQPDDAIEGVAWYHADVTRGGRNSAANRQNAGLAADGPASRERMARSYGNMVREKEAREELRGIFQLLLERRDGAAAIHCYGGKDRTGVTVAAILTALGVSRRDILADYLKTNDSQLLDPDVEYERFCKEMGVRVPRPVQDALAVADPAYLQRAYDAAEELYGGMEGFIRKGIGIGNGEIAHLRDLYLEPVKEAQLV